MRLRCVLIALFLLVPVLIFAQTSTQTTQSGSSTSSTAASTGTSSSAASNSSSSSSGTASTATSKDQPEPYSPTEFPAWLNNLRRAEIITIGAFPISLLATSMTYQLYRYAQNNFSQAYAPALAGSSSTPLTTSERVGVILSGIGLSMVIALVDYGLGKAGSAK